MDTRKIIEQLDREIERLQQARALLLGGEDQPGRRKSRNISGEASRCIALSQRIRHKREALRTAKTKEAKGELKADISKLEKELVKARTALAKSKRTKKAEVAAGV